jgi:hypothetical protein
MAGAVEKQKAMVALFTGPSNCPTKNMTKPGTIMWGSGAAVREEHLPREE